MQDRIIPIIWVLILSLFLIYWDPKGQPWRMQVFLLNLIFFGGTLATWAKGSRSLIKLLVTYVACHFVVYAFHPASPMLAGMDLRTGIILKMRSSLALVSFLACYSFSVGVAHDIKLQLLK